MPALRWHNAARLFSKAFSFSISNVGAMSVVSKVDMHNVGLVDNFYSNTCLRDLQCSCIVILHTFLSFMALFVKKMYKVTKP